MKKSTITAITLLGTLGGILFAVGMCMCLLPEWNAFQPGLLLAALGAVMLLLILPVYRRAAGKPAVRLGGLHIAMGFLGIFGAVLLGIGLVGCLSTVTASGVTTGIVGLLLLLTIIPLARKAAGKGAVHINGKRLLLYCIGVIGTLTLGFGMCLIMVWGTAYLLPGIIVGAVGLCVCILNAALNWRRIA